VIFLSFFRVSRPPKDNKVISNDSKDPKTGASVRQRSLRRRRHVSGRLLRRSRGRTVVYVHRRHDDASRRNWFRAGRSRLSSSLVRATSSAAAPPTTTRKSAVVVPSTTRLANATPEPQKSVRRDVSGHVAGQRLPVHVLVVTVTTHVVLVVDVARVVPARLLAQPTVVRLSRRARSSVGGRLSAAAAQPILHPLRQQSSPDGWSERRSSAGARDVT